MPVRVVDASAIGALLFGEPKADDISGRLAGAVLLAPQLLWFELASVCLKKVTSHRDRTEEILSAFALLERLPIEPVAVDHASVVGLALLERLTTYDASYLWLARHVGADLVTLDKRLAAVAERSRRS